MFVNSEHSHSYTVTVCSLFDFLGIFEITKWLLVKYERLFFLCGGVQLSNQGNFNNKTMRANRYNLITMQPLACVVPPDGIFCILSLLEIHLQARCWIFWKSFWFRIWYCFDTHFDNFKLFWFIGQSQLDTN